MGRALRPIPQELFFLVGRAEEPVLIIFARGLVIKTPGGGFKIFFSVKTRYLY